MDRFGILIRFNNGIILQWGGGNSNIILNYPIAFSNQRYIVLGVHQGTSANTSTICAVDYALRESLTQFKFILSSSNTYYILWLAMGT